MGNHPINLALRFLLELCALAAVGSFGWLRFDSWLPKWGLTVVLPLLFMALWGTFAVPDDPSRGGGAPIPVPGAVRLGLELVLFGGASLALQANGHLRLAVVFAAVVAVHYAVSWDRIVWLLAR